MAPKAEQIELWVWAARLPGEECLVSTLSSDELSRWRSLAEPRKSQFAEGRAAVRKCLSGILHMAPAELSIFVEASGKPRLRNNEFCFSLAHSRNYFALACGGQNLGVDLEQIDLSRDLSRVSERAFGKKMSSEDFFFRWSLLEAHAKALGVSALSLMPYAHNAMLRDTFYPLGSRHMAYTTRVENHFALSLVVELNTSPTLALKHLPF